jgi:hypothetical protein
MKAANLDILKFIISRLQVEEVDILNLQRCAKGHVGV